MSRKVINVVQKKVDKTLFLKFNAEQGETLSLAQTEDLIMMSFADFVENYNNMNNICFVLLQDAQKQYFWGNTTVSIEDSSELISMIAQMNTFVGGVQFVFDVSIEFNAETKEFIAASYLQTQSE